MAVAVLHVTWEEFMSLATPPIPSKNKTARSMLSKGTYKRGMIEDFARRVLSFEDIRKVIASRIIMLEPHKVEPKPEERLTWFEAAPDLEMAWDNASGTRGNQ